MGQKVHPVGFRLGITRTWNSRWFDEKNFQDALHEDIRIRRLIKSRLYSAGISRIDIERAAGRLRIHLHTARPGLVIGRKGTGAEALKAEVERLTGRTVDLNVHEVRHPELNAQLLAENVATQLERRVSFRRAMKKAIQTAMKAHAKGVRLACKGRLGGAEMGRYEWYREGRVPLHTLRAKIDYGFAEARTTYGVIGVKCWIYTGDDIPGKADAPRRGAR